MEVYTRWMSLFDNVRSMQTHNQAENHHNNPRGTASSNHTNGQNNNRTGKKKHKRWNIFFRGNAWIKHAADGLSLGKAKRVL